MFFTDGPYVRDVYKRQIISSSYPYVYEHEKISECMEILTDYEEDSIPVLTQDKKMCIRDRDNRDQI